MRHTDPMRCIISLHKLRSSDGFNHSSLKCNLMRLPAQKKKKSLLVSHYGDFWHQCQHQKGLLKVFQSFKFSQMSFTLTGASTTFSAYLSPDILRFT